MSKLILLRHGQSLWNLENRFTGEVDVDLTEQGLEEAKSAGILLRDFNINVAFTSKLKRAIHTLDIVLHEIGITIPIFQSNALNERNYGKLQGLNKAEVRKKYGSKKVLLWRRSFRSKPPGGESLKDTSERVVPYYQNMILPLLKLDKTVLVVAHGNSLRALTMYLEDLSEQEVALLDIATGIPRSYDYSVETEAALALN
jgi:2,3-bisphosphoglycerate-dependent phosphoglycerate mutase